MTTKLDFSALDIQDALDLAVLVEKEAEDRYLSFADQIGQRYPGDAANFFTKMATNEQRHGNEIAERRRSLFGDIPTRITGDMIEKDIEAPDTRKAIRFMSPWQALKVSMESEIKAFKFYDRILQVIQDAKVREMIKNLRDEEAEHLMLLNEQIAKYHETLEPEFDPEIDELNFHRARES